jgi:hypothetical protein
VVAALVAVLGLLLVARAPARRRRHEEGVHRPRP